MDNYCGYITRLKDLHPLPNSDRLQVGKCFEDSVIVGTDYSDNELVIYFMAGTEQGKEYCEENNLIRKTDENGKNVGGYLEKNRCVKAINLRKSKSDGLALHLSSLAKFGDIENLKEGDRIDVLGGFEIAKKYCPQVRRAANGGNGNGKTVRVAEQMPYFEEHIETSHLDKCLNEFHVGDIVQITLKMDGTSGRTANALKLIPSRFNKLRKFFHLPEKIQNTYSMVTGTRRTIVMKPEGGFYGSNYFRLVMEERLKGKLHKGEEVFYEIVGYTTTGGTPIRPIVANSKLNDKEFTKKYGALSEFSYGCDPNNGFEDDPPCCEMYVYRMTLTNEEGFVLEYSPDQIKRRCQEMGLKYVPEFETFIIPECENPGQFVMDKALAYYDGPDPVGKTHVREGVVVRILNRKQFSAYKLKNHSYKVLAGIAVDQLVQSGEIQDMTDDAIAEL